MDDVLSKNNTHKPLRKPPWLRIRLTRADEYRQMKDRLTSGGLHTICESGACPNKGECWTSGTATFMILGNICTRSCRFCNVTTGKPHPPDEQEPIEVAQAILRMGVKHAVVTSVDRDDLADGGARHWANTIRAIREQSPETTIEVLIPDFRGDMSAVDTVINSGPDIIGHNLETVRRLTKNVRSSASYERSLEVLGYVSNTSRLRTKSGIMLGLGETREEILETMDDLRQVDCKVITIGQYLQPSAASLPVQRYIHPADFERYGQIALEKGFLFAESAPLVRSSYHAEKHVK